MNIEHIKEEYSKAWLYIMASCAGCTVEFPTKDINSVDATIKSDLKGVCGNPVVDVQLKCTINNYTIINNNIIFNLKIKNYNELRSQSLAPKILILLIAPDNPDKWVKHNKDSSEIFKHAFWVSLLGEPDVKNQTSIKIKIPTQNIITVDLIKSMMIKVSNTGAV